MKWSRAVRLRRQKADRHVGHWMAATLLRKEGSPERLGGAWSAKSREEENREEDVSRWLTRRRKERQCWVQAEGAWGHSSPLVANSSAESKAAMLLMGTSSSWSSREGWERQDQILSGWKEWALQGWRFREKNVTMNPFALYNKNSTKQIFILIKNLHIEGARENQNYPVYSSYITCANGVCCWTCFFPV